MDKIIIVDDDQRIIESIISLFSNCDYQFIADETGKKVLDLVAKEDIQLVLLDVVLGELNGIDILEKMRILHPDINVIMISGESDIETAIKSVRLGAFDFIEKPFSKSKLKVIIKNSIADYHNRRKNKQFKKELLKKYSFSGSSPAMQNIENLIEKVAKFDIAVLITGENGTGKEIAARRIHYLSDRASMPFVAVNCASIPKDLLESELFGYKKGAFTGAIQDKDGLFVKAARGTLFLDEIGDMSMALQAKILRVIQEKEIIKLGDTVSTPVDIRLLSATNQNLLKLISSNAFREDLFYRLNGVLVEIAPLRKRKEDLPSLINTFIHKYCYDNNLPLPTISKVALENLENYDFPGNVRELKNIVQRTLVLLEGDHIENFLMQPYESKRDNNAIVKGSLKEVKRELLSNYLMNRLNNLNGDRKLLAKELHIHINNLYRLLSNCCEEKGSGK